MNKVKTRLALLLAAIMITGSLWEPVFAVSRGSAGDARGASAEIGLEDPAQVTETEPLDLVPDGGEPEEPGPSQEEYYTVRVEMDGGYGGIYHGAIYDDALGQDVTDAASFTKKVKKGDAVTFMSGSLYIDGDQPRDFCGWSLEPGGEIVGEKTAYTPTADCTLYANWTKYATFEARGGSFAEGMASVRNMADENGMVPVPAQTPVCDDESREFGGWTLTEGGDPVSMDENGRVQITQDCTFIPLWTDKKTDDPEDPQTDTWTVRIDFDGGYMPAARFDDETGEYISLPSSYTKKVKKGEELGEYIYDARHTEAHTALDGWSVEAEDGTQVTSLTKYQPRGYVPTGNCTIRAVWGEAYRVTLDLDGGYFNRTIWDDASKAYLDKPGKVTVKAICGQHADLYATYAQPDPSNPEWKLLGWSLEKGGESVTPEDMFFYTPVSDCTLYPVWNKKTEAITLDKASLNLYAGASGKLTAAVEPADATDPSVSWKSSDTKVATVDQKGQVKAVAKGTATITATANDGSNVTASCKVTVRQPVTSVSLNKTNLALYKGRTFTLKATLAPSDAYNKKVTWKSGNTAIATVTSAGVVKGIKKGTVTITATAADGSGKKAACTVTVKQPVTSIKLNKTALTLNRGRTFTLKATVSPSNANNKNVKWTTSNKAVATVTAKGVVKGIKKGTVTITATAADGSGKKAACTVTVKQPVTSIKLNKTALTLNKGRSFTLKATVSPSNANNKNIRWTTSNKAVATVTAKGVVKGIKKGTVTITATAADGSGKKATCRITVK